MTHHLKTHFLPSLTTPDELAGGTVAVIDVLRASTTIIHALAAGATEVRPCLSVDDALHAADELPGNRVVLGGERRGQRIEGFQLGNSPSEYTPETVARRKVIFTTTNGTWAMQHCRRAEKVWIAAFVNARAAAKRLAKAADVHLLCAGSNREVTREDVLLAGLLLAEILARSDKPRELNDQARMALELWRAVEARGADLAEELKETQGGRNLASIGLEDDLRVAAERDRFKIVPELELPQWRIRAR